ncbi:hypothetical protein X963_5715 [Burkholderia pseudomallei MSHR7498]|nr:hypothetical protein X963_5715 [Burkholderia pseudomallei MSHR7498]
MSGAIAQFESLKYVLNSDNPLVRLAIIANEADAGQFEQSNHKIQRLFSAIRYSLNSFLC